MDELCEQLPLLDDGLYANQVITEMDQDFDGFVNMILDPQDDVPAMFAPCAEALPDLYPVKQEPPEAVPCFPPQPEVKLHQLQKTYQKLTAQMKEATSQLEALRNESLVSPSQPPLKQAKPLLANHLEGKIAIQRSPSTTKVPSGKPRTAHNLIEKKYRMSINHKIDELRMIVAGDDDKSRKLQKAAVLKKAIDYIHHLQNRNHRLAEHNNLLQKQLAALQQKSVSCVPSPETSEQGSDSSPRTNYTSDDPTSDNEVFSLQVSSRHSSSGSMSSSLTSSIPFSEFTRLYSCFFLVVFLVINPFSSTLMAGVDAPSPVGGRTLLQEDQLVHAQDGFWGYTFLLWLLRILVASFSIGGLMVWSHYKTPATDVNKFWRHQKQALTDIKKGSHSKASHQLQLCLAAAGHSMPLSAPRLIVGLAWNVLCHLLHSLYIGYWLIYLGSIVWHKTSPKRQESSVTCADIASVYHQLHKIRIGETGFYSQILGVYCGLYTLNMCHSNGSSKRGPSLSDANMLMVLQLVKMSMMTVRPLTLYYLECARLADSRAGMSVMQWAWHSEGRRYLLGGYWVKELTACRQRGKPGDPLAVITQSFCKSVLADSFRNLLLPGDGLEVKSVAQLPSHDASLKAFQYVLNIAREANLYQDIKEDATYDILQWWSCIGIVSAHWLAEDYTAAADYYSIAVSLPEALNNSNDPLPSAVLLAFKAVHLHVTNKYTMSELLHLCESASDYLRQSVTLQLAPEESTDDELAMLGQLHVCDWLLGLQQTLWEECGSDDARTKQLLTNTFQHGVESLSYLASRMPEAKRRLYLFRAAQSIMLGENPLHTREMISQTVEQCGDALTSYEHAMAVLLSHKHLPASFECGDDLAAAGKVLHKVGTQSHVRKCQKLLVKT